MRWGPETREGPPGRLSHPTCLEPPGPACSGLPPSGDVLGAPHSPGWRAGWGPCGESVAAVGEGDWGGGGGGRLGGAVVVLDSAGSALSSRPEPPLAWGLATATLHSLLRAHAAAELPRDGRAREERTAEDTLLGCRFGQHQGQRAGCVQKSQGKVAWVPGGPPHRPARGAYCGSGGTQLGFSPYGGGRGGGAGGMF